MDLLKQRWGGIEEGSTFRCWMQFSALDQKKKFRHWEKSIKAQSWCMFVKGITKRLTMQRINALPLINTNKRLLQKKKKKLFALLKTAVSIKPLVHYHLLALAYIQIYANHLFNTQPSTSVTYLTYSKNVFRWMREAQWHISAKWKANEDNELFFWNLMHS